MQDLTALEGKTIVELREIAKVLGITPSNMKKGELISKIVEATTAEPTASEPTDTPKRGRRPRMNSIKVGASPQPRNEAVAEAEVAETPVAVAEAEATADTPVETTTEATPEAQPKRRGRKPKWMKHQTEAHTEATAETQHKENTTEEVVEAIDIAEELLPIEHVSLQDVIAVDEDDEMEENTAEAATEHITKDDFTAIIEGEGVL